MVSADCSPKELVAGLGGCPELLELSYEPRSVPEQQVMHVATTEDFRTIGKHCPQLQHLLVRYADDEDVPQRYADVEAWASSFGHLEYFWADRIIAKSFFSPKTCKGLSSLKLLHCTMVQCSELWKDREACYKLRDGVRFPRLTKLTLEETDQLLDNHEDFDFVVDFLSTTLPLLGHFAHGAWPGPWRENPTFLRYDHVFEKRATSLYGAPINSTMNTIRKSFLTEKTAQNYRVPGPCRGWGVLNN